MNQNDLQQFGIALEISNANAPEDPDVVEMRGGVDNDRIVEDIDVETYYCEIKGVIPTEKYLRIIGDNDFTDVEIRIHHKTLEALGWKKADAEISMKRNAEMAANGCHIAAHAVSWLGKIDAAGGATCGNCGAFRPLNADKRHINVCPTCGNESYDAIELALNAEDLP